MRLLIVVLVVQLVLGGALIALVLTDFSLFADDPPADPPAPRADRFDEERAMALVREQVGYGPRPAGSAASRRLASRLRELLPNGRFEPVPGGLRNVVGSLPGRGPATVVGAHYDTEATVPGHVGANDGAAGTAAVVEIARALRRRPPGRAVRFVLFDGEEEPRGSRPGNFEIDALRGSRAYVAAHREQTKELILLDYVGNRGLRLPREGTSTPALWARVRAAARRVRAGGAFPSGTGAAVIDDHTPFLRAGIPAVDLIDFDYEHADTTRDTPDKLSARALDAVGETIVELLAPLH
jgi:glutaminyl-peptide cyclotransferase